MLLGLITGLGTTAIAQSKDDVRALDAQFKKFYREGKYPEAAEVAKRVLAIEEEALGPEHPDVGIDLNNLAAVYKALGRLTEAVPLRKRALAIDEKALGVDHPNVGRDLNNLATLYEAQGRLAEAEPLYGRALAITEMALGPNHPSVAGDLNNLAALYETQRRLAEAEPLRKRVLAIDEKAFGPDHPSVGNDLTNLAHLYVGQGRYGEAEQLFKRALAIRDKALGPEHPDVGLSLNNLAELYRTQGRYGEAEPIYKRALAIREKVLGPDHPSVATSLNNLAMLYERQGHYSEAEPLYKRSLAITERARGPHHPSVAINLNNLAALYQTESRLAEAEPLMKRALAITEVALGPDHPNVGHYLNNLAELYQSQGRYGEAEPLHKRALAIRDKALGPEHPDVGLSLNNLAELYRTQGRYGEAEPIYKRALATREKVLGLDHPDVGTSLNNLAALYRDQGRDSEAEPLYKRDLAISEKAFGLDHPDVGTSLNNLAELYRHQGRIGEAEPLVKRALGIYEKAFGPEHARVGTSLNNLALLYQAQGRTGEAEQLFKRTIAILETALGPEHPNIGAPLNNLASLYQSQGRFPEAEPLMKRALAIDETALGPSHPTVGQDLSKLAWLALAREDWAGSSEYWRRATALIQRLAERGLGGEQNGSSRGEAQRNSRFFEGLVKATQRLIATEGEDRARRAREMFETAQWGYGSEAAASLGQMAARSASGSPALAALVRERQDLVAEWKAKDKLLIAGKSELPARRNAASETALAQRLAAIDGRLAAIDARFTQEFPDYASLASPKPLTVAEVQGHLRENEALVLTLDSDAQLKPLPEETFIWVVTKTDVRWVRSELGTPSLQREVAALRCGLDYASAWLSKGSRCKDLTGVDYKVADDRQGKPLPFDAARAHTLYKALFGEVEDLISDKHLLVVPSGPLTQLPFHVLVTKKPNPDVAETAWLARSNAITVLPAVSSLKALRQNAKASKAAEPFIGFGDPVLTGQPACGNDVIPETCPEEELKLASAKTPVTRSALATDAVPNFYRDGLANIAAVRALCPLPDTAFELRCVAKSLGAPSSSIVVGRDMTETALKKAPLTRYRVIHFATHGLLAGETAKLSKARAEPALVMSPPDTATEEDDGLLTASEIAALKLDADWVVMSACNTAGGGEQGAEALSGLARAFLYAGARALLVSHWPVNSYAATMLTSRTFAELRKNPSLGRSEGFRRAMIALMDDKARPWAAHPSIWGPFIVVGEGAGPAK